MGKGKLLGHADPLIMAKHPNVREALVAMIDLAVLILQGDIVLARLGACYF